MTHADLGMPTLIQIGMQAPEANRRDLWAISHGRLLGFKLLEPQLRATNLDHTRIRVEVPVLIVAGRYDHVTDATLAQAYFDRISAPQKRFIWFDR